MSGQIGTNDHRDSVGIIDRAADAGTRFIGSAGSDDIGARLSVNEADA